MRRPIVTIAAAFVLGFAALNIAAYWLVPFYHSETSAEAPRNPWFRRGWDRYTDAEMSDETFDVVYVSNSNGYGTEVADEALFAAWIDAHYRDLPAPDLNGYGSGPVRFHNWSAPGTTYSDMTILIAEAARSDADLVMVVFWRRNLRIRSASEANQDTDLIVLDAAMSGNLSPDFLSEQTNFSYFAHAAMRSAFPAVRARQILREWAFADGGMPASPELAGVPALSKSYRPPEADFVRLTGPYEEPRRLPNFDMSAVDPWLHTVDHNPDTPFVFGLMPLASWAYDDLTRRRTAAGARGLQELAEARDNLEFHDFSWSLPSEEFYFHSHMAEANHRAYAGMLTEIIDAHRAAE